MKFCWTTITVKDMDKSLRFYQDVVGLPVTKKMKPNPDMEIVFLGDGDTQVELIYNAKISDIGFGKDISLGFTVESIEQVTELLKTKNIPIHSGPFQPNPYIKFIYVLDPNGVKIQFVENIK
jgi:lactoylglutathione lyase